MNKVRITGRQLEYLIIEFQSVADNIWLGLNYKFFKAWLAKKFGITDVEFDRSQSVSEFTITENCTPEATLYFLKNRQINDL